MKKTKIEKGITLVALIITIVVILILAVVAIGNIEGPGLIKNVKLAIAEWKRAENDENEILNSFLPYLETEDDKKFKELKKYILGENLEGVAISEILSRDDKFTDENLEYVHYQYNGDDEEYYFKYNGSYYKISATYDEELEDSITQDVELIYKQQGREGTKVLYDSNNNGVPEEWIVFTDSNGVFEIVSSSVRYTDTNNDGRFLEGLTIGGSTEEEAIEAYNNAITLINDFCKLTVKATDNSGVRSVGASQENDGPYLEISGKNFKQADFNSEIDFMKLTHLNIASASGLYWLPSRSVNETTRNTTFYVRSVDSSGESGTEQIFRITNSTGAITLSSVDPLGVRPVIINPQLKPADHYIIPATGEESIVENVLLGDIDGDGNVFASDASLIMQIYANHFAGELTDYMKVAADVNQDNIIDYKDTDSLYKNIINVGTDAYQYVTRDAGQIKIRLFE